MSRRKELPPQNSRNTVFIPPIEKYPRRPIFHYVWKGISTHSKEGVVYFSGLGKAMTRVVDAEEVLKRKKPDIHVVFIGIGRKVQKDETTKYANKLDIGMSEKNYKPFFGFLADEKE